MPMLSSIIAVTCILADSAEPLMLENSHTAWIASMLYSTPHTQLTINKQVDFTSSVDLLQNMGSKPVLK